MKKFLKIISLTTLVVFNATAQPPQAFKYQAVVRDNSGEILQNQAVGVRITIHHASPTGFIVYQEIFSDTTNQFGLLTLKIGTGTPTSWTFASINWGDGTKYLEVEIDPVGGTNYVSIGTSELTSVPYALFAEDDGDWASSGNNIYSANSGNVGIGLTNPLYKLHIDGSTLVGSESKGIRLRTNGEKVDVESMGTDLSINYQNGNNTVLNVLTGKVGIGTSSPTRKLHVESSTGAAIYGVSSDSYGIVGESSAQYYAGVEGRALNADAIGLYAHNQYGGTALWAWSYGGLAARFHGDAVFENKVGIYTDNPQYALHVNGTSLFGSLSKGIMMRSTGTMVDIESLGAGLAINYQSGENTVMNVVSGRVGIGTSNPTTGKLHLYNDGGMGIYAQTTSGNTITANSTTGTAITASSAPGTAVFAYSSGWAGYFSGNVIVTGSLSKGGGSFVIDHPLDPENKLLRHNFVESPENLLIYRGKTELNPKGEARVDMPEYYKALTKEDEATIQLTPIGKPTREKLFEFSYEWSDQFDSFIIYGEPMRDVSWTVYVDRDDPVIHELRRPVEEMKGIHSEFCKKGKLLYPKAYGYPEEKGRDYKRIQTNVNK